MYTDFATIGVLQNKRKAQFNFEEENAEMTLRKKNNDGSKLQNFP